MSQPHHLPKPEKADRDRLRTMLQEDSVSPDEVDAMLEPLIHLKRWRPPSPDPSSTNLLIHSLLSEMSRIPQPHSKRLFRANLEWWPLLLMRAQLRIVRREIWAASALVMLLGTVVTFIVYIPSSNGLAPLAILAPLVAAIGVGFLYDTEVEQMREIENSTLASSRMLLLTRLTLVFGFDFILGMIGSILLAAFNAEVSLWPLVMSWLAPMAFLSAASFLLSIVFGDALLGALFGLMVWGVHVWLLAVPGADILYNIVSFPGLSSAANRPILFGSALLLVVITLWIVGREDRIVSHSNR